MAKRVSLRRGTRLYHGTQAEDTFGVPTGAAWFSNDREVAQHFADWKNEFGGRPRVKSYRVARAASLVRFADRDDLEKWFERRGARPGDSEGMAYDVCRAGYDGWIVPDNYPTGDDIMLCSPEQHVERERAPSSRKTRSRRSRP